MPCIYVLTLFTPDICQSSVLKPDWMVKTSMQHKV